MGHILRKRQVHTHKTERNAVNIHKKHLDVGYANERQH